MEMSVDDFKIQLKEALIEDTEHVFTSLSGKLKQNSDKFDEFIILNSQSRMINRRSVQGVLSHEETDIQLNKLRTSILSFINSLNNNDLISELHLGEHGFKEFAVDKKNQNSPRKSESFCHQEQWLELTKVGSWSYNPEYNIISGSGVYQFLLSKNDYGAKDFIIIIKIKFTSLPTSGNFNSGIVLGWAEDEKDKKIYRRYYNLLFNKNKMLLEGIGLYAGDDIMDFVHLDEGVPFIIEDNKEYEITLRLSQKRLMVFIDSKWVYNIAIPENFNGKVGLRPWRSKIECKHFEINEI
jgi:Effector-associated domain 11